jgi:predicted enzyme related to lactoylglutathione lyase
MLAKSDSQGRKGKKMNDKPARFGWNELLTTDTQAAKKFYGEIFGWGWRDVAMDDPSAEAREGEEAYTLWTVKEGEAGGMMKLQGEKMEGVPPHWMSYVSVADVDEVAQKAVDAGGRIIAGPMDIKDTGRFYVIADPQGAVLGIGTSVKNVD